MLTIPITKYKVPFQGFLQTEQDCYSVEHLSMSVSGNISRGDEKEVLKSFSEIFYLPPPSLRKSVHVPVHLLFKKTQ